MSGEPGLSLLQTCLGSLPESEISAPGQGEEFGVIRPPNKHEPDSHSQQGGSDRWKRIAQRADKRFEHHHGNEAVSKRP